MNKPEDIKFSFFNKTLIHEILYDSDKIIRIQLDSEEKKTFYYNFYLVLLILDRPYINYDYSIQYIREINNGNKNIKNEYKLILMSKIIIELINNYNQGNEYNEIEEEKELKRIEDECKYIINRNNNLFLNKEILKNNIDIILLEILNILIINRKFEDNEFIYILEMEKI